MDIDRFKEVRDDIANAPDDLFIMQDYARKNDCGTAMCIAGYAAVRSGESFTVFDDLGWEFSGRKNVKYVAAEYLGLDPNEANYVFLGHWSDQSLLSRITKDEALKYLDKVIESGRVRL